MKILNRHDFLKMPEGTFFAKGEKWCIDGFCIKGETYKDREGTNIDFVYLNLVQIEFFNSEELFDRQELMLNKGESFGINLSYMRDGMFDDDAIFLVFEKHDLLIIQHLITKELEKMLNDN